MPTWVNPLPEDQPGIAVLPDELKPEAVFVVSDLHLGSGADPITGRLGPRENFLDDAGFAGFIAAQQPAALRDPVLVINGDFLDFLRIVEVPVTDDDFSRWGRQLADLGAPRPESELRALAAKERRFGLRTHDYKCIWKLQAMVTGHPRVFQGLNRWVADGGWIVIVKGNHDVELYWPLVQQGIRRAIGGPNADTRILFCHGGLRVANLYLEHGHQHEAATKVIGPPVLPNGEELTLPLGSFVNRYLINPLEWLDPYLDNIKPREALLRKIAQRHFFQVFKILRHAIPFLQRALKPNLWRSSFGFILYLATLLAPLFVIAAGVLAFAGRPILEGLPNWARWLTGSGAFLLPYLASFWGQIKPKKRPRVGEDHYAAALHQTLARVGFAQGYDTVYGILGHTHRPDVQQLPSLHGARVVYLNSGTWTPNWREDRPDLNGRIERSVIRLRWEASTTNPDGGLYRPEMLTWLPETGTTEEARIWSPRTRRAFGFLSDRELATVQAFADVFIAGQREMISPEEIALRVDAHLARIQSSRMKSIKLILFVVEFMLPVGWLRWIWAWPPRWPRFSRLAPAERRQFIERNLTGPQVGRLGRNLSKIRSLFLAAYYGHRAVKDAIKFVPVNDRPRNVGNPLVPLGRRPPSIGQPGYDETELQADICIIGSGAGGAVIAARAAQAGRRVVLLEEGRFFPSAAMSHDEGDSSAALYKEGGLQTTTDLGMTILQGRALGGTTVINNCISFELEDPDLNPAAAKPLDAWEAFGANFAFADLKNSYRTVVEDLGIKRIPADIVGSNGEALLDGWKALLAMNGGDGSYPYHTFKKNYDRCGACGYCNFGCRYERKFSMTESYLTWAADQGARIVTECHVLQVEIKGGRATGVKCRLADGRELTVVSDRIVIAAGAIGSSVLLLKSGITRNVGTRFSFNLATPLMARYPTPINSYDGVQMASYVDSGTFLLESAFNPPLTFAVGLPGWFEHHFDRMEQFTRFASAGVVVPTEPSGRVKRLGLLRSLLGPVRYRMSNHDFATLKRGMATLAETYFAGGADLVLPASFVDSPMDRGEFVHNGRPDSDKIGRFLDRFRLPEDLTLNSSHPQGGNPMSDDSRRGVVGSDFRVHGLDNLFVCDASIYPSSMRINPQLTIMATADYAWRRSIGQ